MLAIVDAGPLYASVDAADRDHRRCMEALQRSDLQLVIPALVVAEAAYMLNRRLGPEIEAEFLAGLAEFDVLAPNPAEWLRIAELVRQYKDFPLGGADASVVALAERFDTDLVITLDYRHFRAIRPRHASSFRLLPDDV